MTHPRGTRDPSTRPQSTGAGSICAMKRNTHAIIPGDRFRLLAGGGSQTTYQFGTRMAKHLFCRWAGRRRRRRRQGGDGRGAEGRGAWLLNGSANQRSAAGQRSRRQPLTHNALPPKQPPFIAARAGSAPTMSPAATPRPLPSRYSAHRCAAGMTLPRPQQLPAGGLPSCLAHAQPHQPHLSHAPPPQPPPAARHREIHRRAPVRRAELGGLFCGDRHRRLQPGGRAGRGRVECNGDRVTHRGGGGRGRMG
jgi:hypothetical protein